MKIVIGLLLIVLGIALGLYVGVWVMFIGGIAQAVEAFKSTPVEALDVAIGVARVFGASLVGTASAFILILPGMGMIGWGASSEPRRGFRGF